jgi:histidine phosphotransferase ChpT
MSETTPVPPEALAAGLAARLLHDLSAPVSAILSSLEILEDPAAEAFAGSALGLAANNTRRLLNMLTFCRVAFGGGAAAMDGRAVVALALAPFEARRPTLVWAGDPPTFSAPAAQVMLILAQIAADALATGGLARAGARTWEGEVTLWIDGEGATAQVFPETIEGLEGRPQTRGLAGRWAPGFWVHTVVARAGGILGLAQRPRGFRLEAKLPD